MLGKLRQALGRDEPAEPEDLSTQREEATRALSQLEESLARRQSINEEFELFESAIPARTRKAPPRVWRRL